MQFGFPRKGSPFMMVLDGLFFRSSSLIEPGWSFLREFLSASLPGGMKEAGRLQGVFGMVAVPSVRLRHRAGAAMDAPPGDG